MDDRGIGKTLEKSQSWSFHETALEFVWRAEENHRNFQ
jgi:hypothetical protein